MLKSKPLDSLSQNETAYFTSKDQECGQHKKEIALKIEENKKEKADSVDRKQKAQVIKGRVGTAVFIVVIVVIGLGIAYYFVVQNAINKAKEGKPPY